MRVPWSGYGHDAQHNATAAFPAQPINRILWQTPLEYALHLDQDIAGATGLPVGERDAACNCLTLTYTKVLSATDLSYTVEAADDPGGPWNITGITQSIIDATTLTLTILASDAGNTFSATGERFLHLKVTRLP